LADEIEAYGSLLDERTKIDRQLKSAAAIFQTLARALSGSPIRLMISNTDFFGAGRNRIRPLEPINRLQQLAGQG
jgi:hypothetical protein